MDMRELRDLIQDILRSDIVEFELEDTGTRLRLRRGRRETETGVRNPAVAAAEVANPAASPAIAVDAVVAARASASVETNGLHFVSSPIVGTFIERQRREQSPLCTRAAQSRTAPPSALSKP